MSNNESELYQKLQILKRNQIQMIKNRGFTIPKEEIDILDESLPYNRFMQIIDPQNDSKKDYEKIFKSMTQIYSNDKNGEKIYVIYVIGGKDLEKKDVNNLITDIRLKEYELNKKLKTCILISDVDIDSKKIKEIGTIYPIEKIDISSNDPFSKFNLNSRRMLFQYFTAREIRRNIINHNLQHKYTALTDQEGREFLSRVGLLPSQLQRFKYVDILLQSGENKKSEAVTDPIVKYYGWRPGQIVRIDGNIASTTFKATYIGDCLIDKTINYRIVSY